MDQPVARRSRREMLFGGVAAAAGLALGRFAQPERVAAADGDPLVAGGAVTADSETSLTKTTSAGTTAALKVTGAGDTKGIVGSSTGNWGVQGDSVDNTGVSGSSTNGLGVAAYSAASVGTVSVADNNTAAGVIGSVGAGQTVQLIDYESGVVGLGESGSDFASGVWGDSSTGAGVVGSGPWGVYGTGGVGVAGDVAPGSTGVYGFVGSTAAPIPTANVGVEARAGSTSYLALNVVGRAKFSRSGRTLMAGGTSFITINLTGVTTSSLVFANLFTYRSGTWVIAATPTTGKFTIRLNKALASSAYVVWMVLN